MLFAEIGGRGLRVTACSTEAARHGVRPGWPLAEARALLCRPGARRASSASAPAWKAADPAADRRALQQLARDAQRFTPLVGLEAGDAPTALLLDIAGCEHLWGDEQGLLAAWTAALAAQGYIVRTAIADTLGAAWAVAHAGANGRCVTQADQADALSPLPISALRVADNTVAALAQMGVHTVAELQQLPRTSLPARFGPELVRRLDQALGRVPEWFTPERFAEPLAATWNSDDAVNDLHALALLFRRLLAELLERLAPQRAGITELDCRLQTETESIQFVLRLSEPTADRKHLEELFRLRCEGRSGSGGVCGLRLEVHSAGGLAEQQQTLFADDRRDAERALARLAERLSSRLGDAAVVRPRLLPEALPEQSYRWEAWGSTSAAPAEAWRPPALLARQRPWRLWSAPQPLQALSLVPDGPPLRLCWQGQSRDVTQCWGPERIETDWWRARDLQRDYYRVETNCGEHWWVFRQRDSGAWFLQGTFD